MRPLFRTGNSVVLSLPRELLESLGIADGEKVSLELDRPRRRLIVTPVDKPYAVVGVAEEFIRQANEFIEQFTPVWKNWSSNPLPAP